MKAYFHFNFDKFQKQISEFYEKYRMKLRQWLYRSCLMIERDAKLNLKPWNPPFEGGKDTGTLQRSIIHEIKDLGDKGLVGRVGPTVHYAKYIEFGTRPHFIPFKHPQIGIAIYRWCVRHNLPVKNMWGLNISGRAIPFMAPAFRKNVDKIFDMLIKMAKV